MGVADLRDAFNAVAEPTYSAAKATLSYKRHNDTEFQILTFSGIDEHGHAFEVRSETLSPGSDVIQAARATAQRLLDQGTPPS